MKWHRINALLLKYWYISTEDLSRLFDLFYWAILSVIMFGFTSVYLESATNIPNIAVYIIGGVMLWLVFMRVQLDLNVFLLEDFWSKTVSNVFITPITKGELMSALSIFAGVRAILSMFIMMFLAAIGYHFHLFNGHIIAALYLIPLFIFGWAIGIFITGIIFRYGTSIQVLTWSISYIFQPLGATYYPVSTLPPVLQKIAYATPLVYTFEGYRAAYAGSFSWHTLFIATAVAIVYFALGFWYFTYGIKYSRKSGELASY